MNVLSDLGSLVSKYAGPVLTYVYTMVGLQGANAVGLLPNSLGTASLAAFLPAGVHLAHDVANDIKGLVKDVKAIESAAQDSASAK